MIVGAVRRLNCAPWDGRREIVDARLRYGITRRAFVMLVGGAVTALGAACAPIQPAAPTQAPSKPADAPKAGGSTPAGQATAAPVAAQPTAAQAAKPTSAPAATKAGGRLTYAHVGGFLNFDGHRFAIGNYPFFNLLYNSLVVVDKDLKPQPELAESWQFSDDNRTLTLKLRTGVKFHNGREFTSEDVKANLERIKDPKTAAHAGPLAEIVDAIETPDSHTAVLRLNRVAPNVFDLLDLVYIIAPESVPDIAQKGIGTGPFKLQEWKPQDQSLFVKNTDYFKAGLPLLNEVNVRVMADGAGMVVFLESGAADVIERFPPQEAARLKGASGIRVDQVWGGSVLDTLINTRQPPFDNKAVRQAMAHAVNRDRAINVSLAGIGEPWCLPFPRNSLAYHADVAARCKFDLEESRRLLQQAGVGSGFEFELLASTSTFPDSVSRAQLYQADLAQLGIRAQIRDVEAADYRERTWGDNYQVAIHAFGRANRDPDTLFRVARAWWPKNNFAGYESPEYTRLVNESGSTLDPEKRRALYKELATLIVDEAFMITVSPANWLFGSRQQVQGLAYNVEGLPVYEQVSLG
jgi:peptide/nickel transport system substrate-binding protein